MGVVDNGDVGSTALKHAVVILPVVGLLVVSIASVAPYVNVGAPISEGWYTEIAWRINSGQLPYRDFALHFPPLYSYMIAAFTSCFGYGLFSLRVFGAIIFVVKTIVLYFISRTVFDRLASFLAVCLAIFAASSFAGSLVIYDYSEPLNLAVYLMTLLLMRSYQSLFSNDDQRKCILLAGLAGLCVGIAIQLKQSTGMMVALFCVVLLLGVVMCSDKKKPCFIMLGSYVGGIAITVFALMGYLVANGVADSFIQSCFFGAIDGKGGLSSELTAWVGREKSGLILGVIPTMLLLVAWMSFCHLAKDGKGAESASWHVFGGVVIVGTTLLLIATIALCYDHAKASTELAGKLPSDIVVYTSFILPLIAFVFLVVQIVRQAAHRKNAASQLNNGRAVPMLVFSGVATACALAVGMSGGLSINQLILGTVFIVAAPMHEALMSPIRKQAAICCALSIVLLATMYTSSKFINLYSWWGLDEGSIWQQTESVNNEILDGLKMSPSDAQCYKGVIELVENCSEDGDTAFVFPHCPILYDVVDRHSNTYTVVQWFDVSSKESLESDMELLRREPPQILILCDLPENVIRGHEKNFGTYWTGDMQDALRELAAESYEELGSFPLSNGYAVHVYSLEQ